MYFSRLFHRHHATDTPFLSLCKKGEGQTCFDRAPENLFWQKRVVCGALRACDIAVPKACPAARSAALPSDYVRERARSSTHVHDCRGSSTSAWSCTCLICPRERGAVRHLRTHVYVIYRRMCEPCRSLHEGCTERCRWRRAVKTRAMSPLSHSAFSVSVVGRALNGTFLVLTNIIYSQAVAQHSLEKLNKKKNATTHMVDHTQDPTH